MFVSYGVLEKSLQPAMSRQRNEGTEANGDSQSLLSEDDVPAAKPIRFELFVLPH
jgi:hypothetical protein